MATIDNIVFADRVRPVRSSAESALVLAARLHKAAPPDISPIEKRRLRGVVDAANDVKLVKSERDRLGPARMRPLLLLLSQGWGALYEGLLAVGRVPAEVSERSEEANALATSLFPDGVGFTQLPADMAWSEAQRRLDRIRDEGLRAPIEEMLGREFVLGAEKVTAKLADAIGTGRSDRTLPSTTALADALGRFARAVSYYVMALGVTSADSGTDASTERFLKATAPVEAFRASQTRGSTGVEEEEVDGDVDGPVVDLTPSSPGVVVAPDTRTTSPGVVVAPPRNTTTSPGVVVAPVVTPANSAPTGNGVTPVGNGSPTSNGTPPSVAPTPPIDVAA